MRRLLLAAVVAASLSVPPPASAGVTPTLEQYLVWCDANRSDCRADIHRYVRTAVEATISAGGDPLCALTSEDHWFDYMLNYLRTQGARANEPAPDVFHDAVKSIYRCII